MLQVQLFLLFPRFHVGNTRMSDQERYESPEVQKHMSEKFRSIQETYESIVNL